MDRGVQLSDGQLQRIAAIARALIMASRWAHLAQRLDELTSALDSERGWSHT